MSDLLHTPGPWRAETNASTVASVPVYGPFGFSVAAVWAKRGTRHPTRETHIEALANAHLIAAAPDLLAALRDCKQGAEYPDELGDIIDAAIAKAEGRS